MRNLQNGKSIINTLQNKPQNQTGFTLIEIMVVIVIIVMLAGLIVPNVIGKGDQARVKATKVNLSSVSNELTTYRIENGRFPTTAEGLEALITPLENAKNFPEDGYLKKYPVDSWDNDIQYVAPGTEGRKYDLFSLGSDGLQGGEGIDEDIYAE